VETLTSGGQKTPQQVSGGGACPPGRDSTSDHTTELTRGHSIPCKPGANGKVPARPFPSQPKLPLSPPQRTPPAAPPTWTFLAWATVHPAQPRQTSEAEPVPPPAYLDARLLVDAADAPPPAALARLSDAGHLSISSLAALPARLPTARAVRVSCTHRIAPAALRALLHGSLVEPGVGYLVGAAVRLTVESVDGEGKKKNKGTPTPARVSRGTVLLQPGDPDPPPPLLPCPERPLADHPRSSSHGGSGRDRGRRLSG
jgi:hypothetical protein